MRSIYAPASPLGGALAVIRISGEKTRPVLDRVFRADTTKPRYMAYGPVVDGEGRILDMAMGVFFPGPNSYTGEDMGELHLHGSPAVVASVCRLLEKEGLFSAEPGEFTKRAFLNGKMDLTEAEAVMDLIRAQSEKSAELALSQLRGDLFQAIRSMETKLMEALSGVEAAIDYPEELEEDVFTELPARIGEALLAARILLQDGLRSRVYREGAKVVIAGRPNVGKSSLLNALLGRERAIVTDLPGTTRDSIEESLVLSGIPIRLWDTAGIREASDEAERIGVALSEQAMEEADLLLLVADQRFGAEELALLERTEGKKRILLLNKMDLGRVEGDFSSIRSVCLSAKTGEGLSELKEAIRAELGLLDTESVLCTNLRHVEALSEAEAAMENALYAIKAGLDPDCLATDLRSALLSLGRITGSKVTESLIDTIFSRFCVGK